MAGIGQSMHQRYKKSALKKPPSHPADSSWWSVGTCPELRIPWKSSGCRQSQFQGLSSAWLLTLWFSIKTI